MRRPTRMAQTLSSSVSPIVLDYAAAGESNWLLLRQLVLLSVPVLAEHMFHIVVGLTDTYMANHLPVEAAAATAAVGTISYFLWFIGLIITAIGTGSTAIIARAKGARHRSLANAVCGQSILAAMLLGLVVGLIIYAATDPLVRLTRLEGQAYEFAHAYLRLLAWSVPFSTVMFVANSCLRGAGDTLTPAITMVLVDVINIALTFGLTLGLWGLPELGFNGIAAGTVIAYIAGGMIQFSVLLAGRGGLKLHVHRLRPHWHTLKRILRVGVPTGVDSLLVWVAQFAVIMIINQMDASNRVQAAHNNAVRLEAFSYMGGFAVATAVATMVGQSLGARNARRATRSAYLGFAVGGAMMVLWGLVFILLGGPMARWMSPDPVVASLTARCLFIGGFVQAGFAAAIIFSFALRGAGDTLAVMALNLGSIFLIRLVGVYIVGQVLGGSLAAIWMVLSAELMCRGAFLYGRFLHGGWKSVEV